MQVTCMYGHAPLKMEPYQESWESGVYSGIGGEMEILKGIWGVSIKFLGFREQETEQKH